MKFSGSFAFAATVLLATPSLISADEQPSAGTAKAKRYTGGYKDGQWPQGDTDNAIAYCSPTVQTTTGGIRKGCSLDVDNADTTSTNSNIRGCHRIKDPCDTCSLGIGRNLKCTVFFDSACRYGAAKKADPGQVAGVGKFPETIEKLEFPGRGTFSDDTWKKYGFSSAQSKGRSPKSVLCWAKAEQNVGLY